CGGNVGSDGKGNCGGTVPGTSPDNQEQAEGGNELAEPLSRPATQMCRGGKERQTEHQMCHRHSGEGPGKLRQDIRGSFTPCNSALPCIGERDSRIEMRS